MNEKEFNKLPKELKKLTMDEAFDLSKIQKNRKDVDLYLRIYDYKMNIKLKEILKEKDFVI